MNTPTEIKPLLRADARRNREKIIEGARQVFARSGASAQMEDVARASGVGVGTVYRHFPTKEALMTELVRLNFVLFIDRAQEGLADPGEPFEAFADVLRRNAELMADDAAVQQALMGAGPEVWAGTEAERRQLGEISQELVQRAQAVGTSRCSCAACARRWATPSGGTTGAGISSSRSTASGPGPGRSRGPPATPSRSGGPGGA